MTVLTKDGPLRIDVACDRDGSFDSGGMQIADQLELIQRCPNHVAPGVLLDLGPSTAVVLDV